MSLKHLLYTSFIFLLFFSCRKNEDLTEVTVTYPEAEEIEVVQLEGKVTDEIGTVIGNTTIELYKKEQLVQTTVTNEEGYFSFENLTFTDTTLLVWAKIEDAYRGFKSYQMSRQNLDEISIQLLSETYLNDIPLLMGGDTNFIVINGQAEPEENFPINGAFKILLENGQLYSAGTINSTGYYEALAPKNTPFVLEIFNFCGEIVAVQNHPALSDFTTIETISFPHSGQIITLSGTLQNNNFEPVPNALVFIQSTNGDIYFELITDDEGFFSVNTFDCLLSDSLFLLGFDDIGGSISTVTFVPFLGGDVDFGIIILEESDFMEEGVFLEYNSEFYVLENHFMSIMDESMTIVGAEDNSNRMILEIDGAGTGLFPATFLSMELEQNFIIPTDDNLNIMVEVTYIDWEEDRIEGHFFGEFMNSISGDVETVCGHFYLPIE